MNNIDKLILLKKLNLEYQEYKTLYKRYINNIDNNEDDKVIINDKYSLLKEKINNYDDIFLDDSDLVYKSEITNFSSDDSQFKELKQNIDFLNKNLKIEQEKLKNSKLKTNSNNMIYNFYFFIIVFFITLFILSTSNIISNEIIFFISILVLLLFIYENKIYLFHMFSYLKKTLKSIYIYINLI